MCSSKAYVDDIIQISTLKRHKAINKTETSMIFKKKIQLIACAMNKDNRIILLIG